MRAAGPSQEFDSLILAAMSEGLTAVLGHPQDEAVLWHLKRIVIAREPGAFSRALQSIFGQGAWILEDAILRRLYEKVGVKYDCKDDAPFEKHVEQLREAFTARSLG